jgi:hypothetical protein
MIKEYKFRSADEAQKITAFSCSKSKGIIIETKKICRLDSRYGNVKINITVNDTVLKSFVLNGNEFVFANFIGNEIVEIFPAKIANNFKNNKYEFYFKSIENGDLTLERKNLERGKVHAYEAQEITHFTLTDDNGFVGIANGKLIQFTGNNYNFDKLPKNEYFVSVALRGNNYAVLAQTGKIYSNVKLGLSELNIVSIFIDKNN